MTRFGHLVTGHAENVRPRQAGRERHTSLAIPVTPLEIAAQAGYDENHRSRSRKSDTNSFLSRVPSRAKREARPYATRLPVSICRPRTKPGRPGTARVQPIFKENGTKPKCRGNFPRLGSPDNLESSDRSALRTGGPRLAAISQPP
jgi:hypothetical protein